MRLSVSWYLIRNKVSSWKESLASPGEFQSPSMEWIGTIGLPIPVDTYHKSRVCCWQLHPESPRVCEWAVLPKVCPFTFYLVIHLCLQDENCKLFAFSPPDIMCWDSQAPLFSAPAAASGRRCLPSVPDCTRALGAHALLYKSRGWCSRKELTLWAAARHPLPCGKGIPSGG